MCTLLVEIQLTVSSVKRNKGPQGAEILRQLHAGDTEIENRLKIKNSRKNVERLGRGFNDWKRG